MNDRVLQTLEFDKIRELVASCATSDPGRRLCEELRPYEDRADAERALTETADAMARALQKGSVSFGATRDLKPQIKALAVGSALDMGQLCAIASFLENVARAKAYGDRPAGDLQRDTLSDLFSALEPLQRETGEIRRCVLSEDEIAPDASPKLKEIRRQIAAASERVRDVLNRMVNGAARTYLQDAVVTMRGDRYCLPVRAEHKAQVKGIVHDRSSTGSTLFIEPESVVQLNNQLKEYALAEEKEILRILAELSAMLSDHVDALSDNVTYMALLDFIFAKASYALDTGAMRPAFSKDGGFSIKKGRHPLIDKERVVPVDVMLGDDKGFRMLVITGPNTGGKTVTLKTAGLLTVMGMSGLCVPAAEETTLSFYREIYADIGDEQSIEQSLSTFSGHMTSVVGILKQATKDDLCLFDELGAGTDPTEGAALAIAILSHLLERGASALATTHYAELKVFAMTTAGVKNASCEFDVETLKPTYRLLIGTPGASNAFAISRKLGLPEDVIEGARAQIDTDKARMETLFDDLEQSRKTIETEREEIDRYKKETQELNARLKEQTKAFDALGEDVLKEAHEEAARVLQEAKSFADETIRLMRKAGADDETLAALERARTKLNDKLSGAKKDAHAHDAKERQAKKGALRPQDVTKGARVRILSMDLTGTVVSKPDKDGKVFVQCGVMQVESRASDLELLPEETGRQTEERFLKKRGIHLASAPTELNLIGKNTDDAISALDKYLDEAYIARLPSVRIVHGKGTGTLRAAVQRYLKGVKYVKSYQTGAYGEGDAGVTVVKFKS